VKPAFSLIFAVAGVLSTLALTGCKSDQEQSSPKDLTSPGPSHVVEKTTPHENQTTPPANTTIDNEVVATVRGDAITLKDLEPVLMEAYGLDVLLKIVELNLVRQEAARLHVVITPQDIANEKTLTMIQLKRAARQVNEAGGSTTQPDVDISPEEAEQLLQQVMAQGHLSRPEFDILMEINAHLRAISAPQVDKSLTEDAIHNQFNVMYGEKIRVKYIDCSDMAEAAQVSRDLAAGKNFDDLMRIPLKTGAAVPRGGDLPPFTINDNRLPPEFRQVAFQLKTGEVSDAISINGHFYIVKLIERISPEHAKYEDYRDSVRRELRDQAILAAMSAMRQNLGKMALDSLNIKDPILRRQWDQRMADKTGEIHDDQEIRRQLDAQHAPPTRPAATAPADMAAPATKPATAP
jgi:foldase protein PrsA